MNETLLLFPFLSKFTAHTRLLQNFWKCQFSAFPLPRDFREVFKGLFGGRTNFSRSGSLIAKTAALISLCSKFMMSVFSIKDSLPSLSDKISSSSGNSLRISRSLFIALLRAVAPSQALSLFMLYALFH